jgi:dsRNA-specific ribonuclease
MSAVFTPGELGHLRSVDVLNNSLAMIARVNNFGHWLAIQKFAFAHRRSAPFVWVQCSRSVRETSP